MSGQSAKTSFGTARHGTRRESMAELRILVANEPRSYREVLAGSLG